MDALSRQDYIRAAISFLQNPKLVDSPLQDKLKFLRDKGLTEIEVDEALNLALVERQKPNNSRWNFFVILGLCFSGYKLYRAYIESKTSETTKPKVLCNPGDTKEVSKSNSNIEQSVNNRTWMPAEPNTATLSELLEEVRALKSKTEWCKSSLSADIKALQTLLLGHEKLAAPPMIPSWQMDPSLRNSEKEEKLDQNSSSAEMTGDDKESNTDKSIGLIEN